MTTEPLALPQPRTAEHGTVSGLVEAVWTRPGQPHHGLVGLRLDAARRPLALLVGPDGDHLRVLPVSLCVPATAEIDDVARQLLERPATTRFDPLVCVDGEGRAIGVVRVERVFAELLT